MVKKENKRPQMTSHEPNPIVVSVTKIVAPVKPVRTKNELKGRRNLEIDHEYLDESLHNINLWECKNALCLFYTQ